MHDPRLLIIRAAVTPPLIVAGLLAIGMLAGPREGVLALAGILSPHLVLACLALLPLLAARTGRASLAIAFAALGVVALARFGSEWLSVPSAAAAVPVRVATWNLEFGAVGAATAVDGLRGLDVDLIALQELTPEQAMAIEADPAVAARFPFRALAPRVGVAGIGILSTRPLDDVEVSRDPVSIRLDIGTATGPITVIAAHPFPARIATATSLRLPVGFEPGARDAALRRIRQLADTAIATGARVILLGDFNVAPTEPGYADLTRGLLDAHVEAGTGPGWTWRPSRFEFLPIAFCASTWWSCPTTCGRPARGSIARVLGITA